MVSVKDNKNEDEPSFSDDEDYIDPITNEELLPELMATEPRKDESIDKIIVVDNIPKVGQDKKEKLKQILSKLLQSYGTIVNQYFPEDSGVTKGLAFSNSIIHKSLILPFLVTCLLNFQQNNQQSMLNSI